MNGWSDDPDDDLQRAAELVEAAMELGESIPQVHFARSVVFRLRSRYDEAIDAARQVIALDPNYADGYAVLAAGLNVLGRSKDALAAIRTAMRLNPRHPFFYIWIKGQCYFLMEDYAAAATEFEKVIKKNPHFPLGHVGLAASYGHMGRVDDANWEAAEVLTLLPGFLVGKLRETTPYMNPVDLERWFEGLRKAGLPE
jgi:tetratricopeptide (TPR) repeat protein